MVSLKEMRVYIQRDVDATVTELLLDIFYVRILLNQQAGEGVPQVMESYPPKPSRFETSVEVFPEDLIRHTVAMWRQEYPFRESVSLHRAFKLKMFFQLEQLGL